MPASSPQAAIRLSLLLCALLFILLCAPLQAQPVPQPPGTGSPDSDSAPAQAHPAPTDAQPAPLTAAEAAIEAKQYDQARTLLDTYLSPHPADARALFDRGYCDDAQGRTAAAEGWYRKAIAADPKQFESRLALGLILAQQNDPGAREQLQSAAMLDPDPPNAAAKAQALRALAKLVRNTDPDTAKQALLDALKITPESPDDILLTAQIAEAEGNPALAERAYRRALNADPQSSAATAGLAHLLIAEKKYADAEPLVQAALGRDPDDPALNAQYAAVLGAEGKTAEAVVQLEKLYRLEPQNRQVGEMLADAYSQGQSYEKADAVYRNLLAAAPDDPELETALGQILIREQKDPEALELFQRAVKIKQDESEAWGGIAFTASATHQYDLVLQALTMRSKYVPETPATYFLWATANDNLHRKVQALEYYRLFLKSALGKFPTEEWQAKQRLAILQK